MREDPVNNVPGACPSHEELIAFHDRELPESALNRVAQHIETSCPQCVAALDKLERADPLLAHLREPLPLPSATSCR